ncbi:hypothetical protein NMY22_g2182 [Coprinellus aureogranulatus]|nr:hypothetical protein NMY22_g2182 [Coprinellus aureogranulatus]
MRRLSNLLRASTYVYPVPTSRAFKDPAVYGHGVPSCWPYLRSPSTFTIAMHTTGQASGEASVGYDDDSTA